MNYRSDDVADLAARLEDAATALAQLAIQQWSNDAVQRLMAKRSGVLLALDYCRAYRIPTSTGSADQRPPQPVEPARTRP